MTRQEFYEKLNPFFTDEQIDNMDNYALEAAKDAHEGLDLSETYLHHIGREFVCIQLYELADDYETTKARYEEIAGGYFSEESYDDLMEMFDDEW